MIEYIMAHWSRSFVCTLYYLIIIIMQTFMSSVRQGLLLITITFYTIYRDVLFGLPISHTVIGWLWE